MPAIDHGPEELPGGGREDDGVGARRPGGRSQRGRPAPLAANRQARPTVASALIGGAILRAVLASATAHLTYGSYGIWGDRPGLGSSMQAAWVVTLVTWVVVGAAWGGNFSEDVEIVWGESRAKIFNHGQLLELSMDKDSGSAFKSRNEYLFGRIDMQLKLVAGNSAGTVTTYYVTSVGDAHDEIDFEFLGNVTGEPYILHTNVFSQGKGNREVQFYLWFDPTKNFHTYSILWNPQHIIFFVDGIPIRDFKNSEHKGVPFPKSQPMRIRGSLWDAEGWATRGGLEKTDWSEAPFRAFYRNLQTDGCVGWTYPYCMSRAWFKQELDAHQRRQMRWVKKRFMIYNYCADGGRFAGGLPPECS